MEKEVENLIVRQNVNLKFTDHIEYLYLRIQLTLKVAHSDASRSVEEVISR